LIVLWALKRLDRRLPKRRRATLSLTWRTGERMADPRAADLGLDRLEVLDRRWANADGLETVSYSVDYRAPEEPILRHLAELSRAPGCQGLRWSRLAE
jgi:hypothetical protein